ncbi:MAG TPA: chemotaxis protein CheX [Vicinamibacterales bacterium]|nr:chemotaxis protein CheX [Vicinamibacterales bacterium]
MQALIHSDAAAAALFDAVRCVAERSFFSVAEPGHDEVFDLEARRVPKWLSATVRFEQGGLAGSVSCTLPELLAHSLFDAFTGRDPAEPPPTSDLLVDVVGEFSNMVCGAWLTRVASGRAFTLSRPRVEPTSHVGAIGDVRVLAAIDDRPVAVDVCVRT